MDMENQYKDWMPSKEDINSELAKKRESALLLLSEQLAKIMKDMLIAQYEVELSIQLENDLSKQSLDNLFENDTQKLHKVTDSYQYHVSQNMMSSLVSVFYGGEFDLTNVEGNSNSYGMLSQHAIVSFVNLVNDKLLNFIEPYSVDDQDNAQLLFYKVSMKHDDILILECAISDKLVDKVVKVRDEAAHPERIQYTDTSIDLDIDIKPKVVLLDYIQNLKEGDLIPLETNNRVRVLLDNKVIVSGELGMTKDYKSVKVSRIEDSMADVI